MTLHRLVVCLLLAAALFTGGCRRRKYENPITKDTEQPDKVLFDKAIKDIEKGRYEVARITLNTLMNTYDTSEYLAKAKLAIADSWMREGGSSALAQAEAEYKDFILFYPTMEESAESQYKICDIHFRQMDKADRDNTHVLRAEEECRQLLTSFPNSRFAPMAAQRLRNIQEVISDAEFRVGSYYFSRGAYVAASNRLQAMTDHYPLFSQADEALLKLGDSYGKMGPRVKNRSIASYQKLVREYPLSPLVDEAKKRLKGLEAEIPEADPVAVARMKYEQENVTERGMWGKVWGTLSKSPDMTKAAKSGQPTMTALRPTTPLTVPSAAAEAGITDVTVSAPGDTSASPNALDTKPDARLNQPGQPAAGQTEVTAKPADPAKPEEAAAGKNAKKQKKPKKEKK